MGTYTIKTDLPKNRLFLSLTGFLTDDQMKVAAELLISEAKKLKPGFSVINDISTFQPASKTGTEEIHKAQLFVKEHGVGRVIRVVAEKTLAAQQFNRVTKTTGYEVDEASSIEEAEKLLDSH